MATKASLQKCSFLNASFGNKDSVLYWKQELLILRKRLARIPKTSCRPL